MPMWRKHPLGVRNSQQAMSFRAKRGISPCLSAPMRPDQSVIPRFALRKDDAYVLYIQRNRSNELASSFCLSWAAKRLSMLGMTCAPTWDGCQRAAIRATPSGIQRQTKVVIESSVNEIRAALSSHRNSIPRAAPALVTTNTCWPSGFSSAACWRSAAVLCESKRRAPRRMTREK